MLLLRILPVGIKQRLLSPRKSLLTRDKGETLSLRLVYRLSASSTPITSPLSVRGVFSRIGSPACILPLIFFRMCSTIYILHWFSRLYCPAYVFPHMFSRRYCPASVHPRIFYFNCSPAIVLSPILSRKCSSGYIVPHMFFHPYSPAYIVPHVPPQHIFYRNCSPVIVLSPILSRICFSTNDSRKCSLAYIIPHMILHVYSPASTPRLILSRNCSLVCIVPHMFMCCRVCVTFHGCLNLTQLQLGGRHHRAKTRSGWLTQFRLLLKRSWKQATRDKFAAAARLINPPHSSMDAWEVKHPSYFHT